MQDGDIVTYKDKQHKVSEGRLIPIEERGPLGGVLQTLDEVPFDIPFYGRMIKRKYSDGFYSINIYEDPKKEQLLKVIEETFAISKRYKVETDIPDKVFTRIHSTDAAKIPDMVGRYVALKIDAIADNRDSVRLEQGIGWLDNTELLILEKFYPEGVTHD